MKRKSGAWKTAVVGAAILCAFWHAAAYAAGPKTSADGTVVVTDDLVNDSAGSVGLTGTGGAVTYKVSGSLGQLSVVELSATGLHLESGYFSKMVFAPTNPSFAGVFVSSFTFTFAAPAANPTGTLYIVRVSTDSLFGNATAYSLLAPPLAVTGLTTATTYYVRAGADYMLGDSSYTAVVSTRTQVVPELLVAVSTPTYPKNGSFVNVQPNFNWIGPSTTTIAALGPGTSFYLQVSNNDPSFAVLAVSITTPAVVQNASLETVSGSYFPSVELAGDTTYYWRVRTLDPLGNPGPWSTVSIFMTDFTSPTASGFVSFNSTGGAPGEMQVNNLASGVTAQMTVQDAFSGLNPAPLTTPISPGIIGLWHLDDGAGATANDAAGNGNTGTLGNSPTWQAGSDCKFVGCVGMNGTSAQYASLPAPALGTSSGPFTIAMWVKPNANAGVLAHVSNTPTGGPTWCFPFLGFDASGHLTSQIINNGGGYNWVYVGGLPLGVWSYVAETWSYSTSISLYVNGALAIRYGGASSAGTTIYGPSGSPDYVLAGSMGSGKGNCGTGFLAGTDFNGSIDDVAVYSRALSDEELRAHYLAGNPYSVQYSTNAGSVWNTVSSTSGPGPFVSMTGSVGTTDPQTLKVSGLNLVQSTNPTVTCGGNSPCGATNQVKFTVSDMAGNVRTAGPFAVLVDTTPPSAPSNVAAYQSGQPNTVRLQWVSPGDDGFDGELPLGSEFRIQYTDTDPSLFNWNPANAQVIIPTGPVGVEIQVSTSVALPPEMSLKTLHFKAWARDEAGNRSGPSEVASAFVSPFSFETVDTSMDNRASSLVIGKDGKHHLAYFAGPFGPLMHRRYENGSWSSPQTIYNPPTGGIEGSLSLAAGTGGRLAVSFYDYSKLKVFISEDGGATWSGTDAESSTIPIDYAAAVIDAAGNIYVVYTLYNGTTYRLKLATYQNGTGLWTSVEITNSPTQIQPSQDGIALDGAGNIYFAFLRNIGPWTFSLAKSTDAGQSWTFGTIETLGAYWYGPRPSIALDGDGHIHAAYSIIDFTTYDSTLTYTFSEDGGITFPTKTAVDSRANCGPMTDCNPSLALDGSGKAHIAYSGNAAGGDYPVNDLKYASNYSGAWSTQTIDSAGAFLHPSLSLDGSGNVHVAYRASPTGGDPYRLKAAHWAAAFPPPMGGNPRGRVQAPTGFGPVPGKIFKTSVTWTWTDNSTNETGFRLYGAETSTGPFSLIASTGSQDGTGSTMVFTSTGLIAGTTYFRYVAAVNAGGVVPSSGTMVRTLGFDKIPPRIENHQAGDDSWRRMNNGSYDVRFFDNLIDGSGLDRFDIQAGTTPAMSPSLLPESSWVMVSSGISPSLVSPTTSYTASWRLPQSLFDALMDEATSYISIRITDRDENVAVSTDVFYVRKDASPPRITPTASAYGPLNLDPGEAVYATFSDPGSGLDTLEYSAGKTTDTAEGNLIPWTALPMEGGTSLYQNAWQIDFGTLADEATNYIYLRALDMAGNTQTLKDAFTIVKDTSGPKILISVPANNSYRSSLSEVSGTAADFSGIKGVEISIYEKATDKYWGGGAFDSASVFWNALPGQPDWSFDAASVAWSEASIYTVVARSSDTLGNYSTLYSTVAFRFDLSSPTAAVTYPSPGGTIDNLPLVVGIASDSGGSGMSSVEVAFKRLSDGLWWDLKASAWGPWDTTAMVATAIGKENWNYAVPELLKANLASGTSYYVSVRAKDNAIPANMSDFSVSGATFTFLDISSPAAVLNLSAAEGAQVGQVALSWTSTGDDGNLGVLATAYFIIQYATSPSVEWSTASAQSVSTRTLVFPGSAMDLTLSGLSPGATYFFGLWTRDDAGNTSAVSNHPKCLPRSSFYLAGKVTQADGQGLSGIFVEAFDASGALAEESLTDPDGSGEYKIPGLPAGKYRIQATWTVDDFSSSVDKDGVPGDAQAIDFTLSISYTLASIAGQIQPSGIGRARAKTWTGVRRLAAAETGAFVELHSKGRMVAAAPVKKDGRYSIVNLLPGTYQVRTFDGASYSETVTVRLKEGQQATLGPGPALLPEASVFAFPNPAKDSVTIRFESKVSPIEASVAIYDVAGAPVKELGGSRIASPSPGLYHAVWDTANESGRRVASGVYLFVVKAKNPGTGEHKQVTKKLAVIR